MTKARWLIGYKAHDARAAAITAAHAANARARRA